MPVNDEAVKDEQMVDYTAMDAPTLLSFVRDDAWKWAEAFMQTVATGVVVDREFMIGWFANAIEHSTAIRQPQVDAALATARRAGFDAAKEQAATWLTAQPPHLSLQEYAAAIRALEPKP